MLSVRFRKQLDDKKYTIIKDPRKADIIITHSGGCYAIPQNISARQVIMVAPCYNFRYSKSYMAAYKFMHDLLFAITSRRILFWFYKSIWNTLYLLFRPINTVQMYHYSKTRSATLPSLEAKDVLIITYRNDLWSRYVMNLKENFPKYDFRQLSSAHDEIWYDPHRYIQLIKA